MFVVRFSLLTLHINNIMSVYMYKNITNTLLLYHISTLHAIRINIT